MTNDDEKKHEDDLLLPPQEEYERRGPGLARYLAKKESRTWFRRPAGVVSVAAGALVVSVGVASATGILSADDVAVSAGISCYEKPSLSAENIGMDENSNPAAACAKVMSWGVPALGPNKAIEPVVGEFTACAAEDQPVRVFPAGPDICGQLGLDPLPADYKALAVANQAIKHVLKQTNNRAGVYRQPCVTPSPLRIMAKQYLKQAGFPGRSVTIEGDLPCANYVAQADDGHIRIETVTRESSREEFLIMSAFDSQMRIPIKRISDGNGGTCVSASEYIRRFRMALLADGLSEVKVRLKGPGRCLDISSQMAYSEKLAMVFYAH